MFKWCGMFVVNEVNFVVMVLLDMLFVFVVC